MDIFLSWENTNLDTRTSDRMDIERVKADTVPHDASCETFQCPIDRM